MMLKVLPMRSQMEIRSILLGTEGKMILVISGKKLG